jgi:RING finger protein 113A
MDTNESGDILEKLFDRKSSSSSSSAKGKRTKMSLQFKDEQEELEKNTTLSLPTSKLTITSANTTETSKLDYAYSNESVKPETSATATATATNEVDTETDRDHFARRKETLERSKALASQGKLDETYRGLKGYQQFLMQNDTAKANAASDKNRVAGPVRAAANLRVTCRFDYKPDLCKDYNETGFCGFGDSCIFLHDRTEHKSSYQIEKEWDAEQKRKKLEEENPESLVKTTTAPSKPSTCTVCSKNFTRPVKTKCGHYFCEACVLRLKKCPACKSALLGSFTPATKELT